MTSENKLYNSWYRSSYPGNTDPGEGALNNRFGVSYVVDQASMVVNQRSSLCEPIEPLTYCFDKSWDAHHF